MTNHGELKVWGVSQTPLVVTKEHIKNAVTPVTSIHIAVCGTCRNLRCLQPLPYPCGAMCVLLRAASCQPSCASILAQAQSATKEAPEGAVTAKRAAATTCSNAGCQRSAGWYHIGYQQHGLRLSNCVPLLATTTAHTTPHHERQARTRTHTLYGLHFWPARRPYSARPLPLARSAPAPWWLGLAVQPPTDTCAAMRRRTSRSTLARRPRARPDDVAPLPDAASNAPNCSLRGSLPRRGGDDTGCTDGGSGDSDPALSPPAVSTLAADASDTWRLWDADTARRLLGFNAGPRPVAGGKLPCADCGGTRIAGRGAPLRSRVAAADLALRLWCFVPEVAPSPSLGGIFLRWRAWAPVPCPFPCPPPVPGPGPAVFTAAGVVVVGTSASPPAARCSVERPLPLPLALVPWERWLPVPWLAAASSLDAGSGVLPLLWRAAVSWFLNSVTTATSAIPESSLSLSLSSPPRQNADPECAFASPRLSSATTR